MPDEVSLGIESAIAFITIDRPDRLNALDTSAIDALIAHFTRANADPQVRVVVLQASGEKAFCVGADLKEMNTAPPSGVDRARGRRLFQAIHETYKPTIAAINGLALGVGFELALGCDLRIAATHANMGLPEAKIGLGAMFGSVALPRLLPHAVAMKMLYTGESISAEEALHWGLVNSVVPVAELGTVTQSLANSIVANAPLSVNRFKHVAVKSAGLSIADALQLEVGPDPYTSEDRDEGVRAFIEKRPPRWRGV